MTSPMAEDSTEVYIILDLTNPYWTSMPESNELLIRHVQSFMNKHLIARGHVFLNEVFDNLGLMRTRDGAVMGWFWEDGSKQIELKIVDMQPSTIEIRLDTDGIIYNRLPA